MDWKRFLLPQGKVHCKIVVNVFLFINSCLMFSLTSMCKCICAESLFIFILLFSRFDAVIHFAGLKAVGESVQKPLLYYDHNVVGTINLLEIMAAHGCKKVLTIYLGYLVLHEDILWSSYLSEDICITIYSVLHIYLQLWTLVSSNISILPVILMLIQHTLSFLYKKYALFIVLKRLITNLKCF